MCLDEIDIEENNLSEEHKIKLRQFLNKWRHLFLPEITDLGNNIRLTSVTMLLLRNLIGANHLLYFKK